ncbi:hypothetical protein, partial [Salinibacter ruber]|uniref:hypothetical protein n=1 Tax=Salinibacter ruber TaxID=146919 RepID=UPI002169C158
TQTEVLTVWRFALSQNVLAEAHNSKNTRFTVPKNPSSEALALNLRELQLTNQIASDCSNGGAP